MNDPEALALKALISQALKTCTDLTLLDLIYKLIISEQSPRD